MNKFNLSPRLKEGSSWRVNENGELLSIFEVKLLEIKRKWRAALHSSREPPGEIRKMESFSPFMRWSSWEHMPLLFIPAWPPSLHTPWWLPWLWSEQEWSKAVKQLPWSCSPPPQKERSQAAWARQDKGCSSQKKTGFPLSCPSSTRRGSYQGRVW